MSLSPLILRCADLKHKLCAEHFDDLVATATEKRGRAIVGPMTGETHRRFLRVLQTLSCPESVVGDPDKTAEDIIVFSV